MAPTFSQAISRQPLRPYSLLMAAVCMLVLVCDGMDAQLLGVVTPLVIAEFGIERGTFGIAMSAALVGFGIGSWGGDGLAIRSGDAGRWRLPRCCFRSRPSV